MIGQSFPPVGVIQTRSAREELDIFRLHVFGGGRTTADSAAQGHVTEVIADCQQMVGPIVI